MASVGYNLHLFLRISDVLINLFIMELRRMDGIEKIKIKEFSKSNANFLHTYVEFLTKRLHNFFSYVP